MEIQQHKISPNDSQRRRRLAEPSEQPLRQSGAFGQLPGPSQPLRQANVFIHLYLSCVPRSHQHLRQYISAVQGVRYRGSRLQINSLRCDVWAGNTRAGAASGQAVAPAPAMMMRYAALQQEAPNTNRRYTALQCAAVWHTHLAACPRRRQRRLSIQPVPQAVAALVPQGLCGGAHALGCR